MTRALIILTAGCLLLTGCATLTGGRTQELQVESVPSHLPCLASNTANQREFTTPASIQIERGFEPLWIECRTANGTLLRESLEATTRGRAYGNILLLGVPAVVDAYTGAGYEYVPASVLLKAK
jgi:hypothetical protein